jgi:hypothetical protein
MIKVISDIQKNQREVLRVALDEFKGHQLVAARLWFDDGSGELKPTPKGLTIKVELLPELIAALRAAETAVRDAGLLGGQS